MNRPLLLLCLCTLLTVDPLAAQGFGAAPRGMPLLPSVTGSIGPSQPVSDAAPAMPGCGGASEPADPATTGPQLAGKELARAIATVTALRWYDDLDAARVESAATGKPILWLQALGELDGFA
ncbi:MAG: hypothetical protein JNM25_04280 [Planctomycetes bacterium]|nr:hypothetical protein [Planctomycetota bacterium]